MAVYRRGRRNLIAISVLVALVSVAAFVYSPLHQHSQNSNQVCSLSQYGFTYSLEAGAEIPIVPPTQVAYLHPASEDTPAGEVVGTDSYSRAPPS